MNPEVLDSLAESFASDHPGEAALALAELPAPDAAAFLEACPLELAAAVAQRMVAQEWVACLRCMTPDRVVAVSREMPAEQVASALRRLTAEERAAIVEGLPAETRRLLKSLLRYEEDTAGSLMEPAVLAVPARVTAGRALELVGREPRYLRYYVYVVDERERLVGVVDLRRLTAADRDASMESLMTRDVHRLSARARREAILEHPGWEHVHALPVTDENNVLVGLLRHETVRRLARRKPRRSADSGSPAAALAELYWSGSQRVVGELVTLARRRSP